MYMCICMCMCICRCTCLCMAYRQEAQLNFTASFLAVCVFVCVCIHVCARPTDKKLSLILPPVFGGHCKSYILLRAADASSALANSAKHIDLILKNGCACVYVCVYVCIWIVRDYALVAPLLRSQIQPNTLMWSWKMSVYVCVYVRVCVYMNSTWLCAADACEWMYVCVYT